MSVLTKDVLNSIEEKYNRPLPEVFIETGTFKGETVSAMTDMFSEIHTIELDERWYKEAVNKFKAEGKTIVFVSHALPTVKELCQRTILLNEGRIVTMGDTEKVINDYLAMLQRK